jgi:hypothetical protein
VTPTQTPDPATPIDGLAFLAAQLDTAVPQPTVTIECRHRDGWAVKYRTDFSRTELIDWRRTARDDESGDLLNRLILASTCIAFAHKGADGEWAIVRDDAGAPLTFGAIARKNNSTVAEAVKKWLVTDGQVAGTADRVFLEAGYAVMPDVIADPTQA